MCPGGMRFLVQLSIDTTADMRQMAGRAISRTAFPLETLNLTLTDAALGVHPRMCPALDTRHLQFF